MQPIRTDANPRAGMLTGQVGRTALRRTALLRRVAPAAFAQVESFAIPSGCSSDLVDLDDVRVAWPWLEDLQRAHRVSTPFTLNLASRSVGP